MKLFIGGLLSEYKFYSFDKLFIRPILLRDMPMVEALRHFKRPMDVAVFLQSITDLTEEQVMSLTLGDCVYIFTYLRRLCYTDTPITVTWNCSATVVSSIERRLELHPDKMKLSEHELQSLNLHRRVCGRKNTELIYPYSYSFDSYSADWATVSIPDGLRVPTLLDAHLIDEMKSLPSWSKYSAFHDLVLWLKGNTIEEKQAALSNVSPDLLIELSSIIKSCGHGIRISYPLRCSDCQTRHSIVKDLDVYSVLPMVSSESVMNMQYSLLGQKNVLVSEDTPIQKLLYWYNAYQKDKREKANTKK